MSETQKETSEFDAVIRNSLSSLATTLFGFEGFNYPSDSTQLSQVTTLQINNRWYLISNYRQLLSQIYVEHGVVQTLIDQPVDDAFRSGFEVKTNELDGDEIEQLMIFVKRYQVLNTIMQAKKWSRLFGGGAIIIITDQDPATPLDIEAINEDTPLDFRAVDMWELYHSVQNVEGDLQPGEKRFDQDEFYDYYGKNLHHTRVYRLEGKAPPSFVRPRLRGWGMSEVERLVRSLNQYMKNQDVVFDLLDEAKVDIYKMKGFNSALLNENGTGQVAKRIQSSNILKNYNHALTMDADDDYDQKQITFTGLAEVLTQIRQGLASDLKMPLTKLFGVSSAGFNSGEDDIENYNSMLEGEIRSKIDFLVVDILQICCRKKFGFNPSDLMIQFNPLREMSAKEQEEVKDRQFNRVLLGYNSGLVEGKEAKESINKASLLPTEIDADLEASPPLAGDFNLNPDAMD